MSLKHLSIGVIAVIGIILINACGERQPDCPEIKNITNQVCPTDTAWVCACDDSTYINACLAEKRGLYIVSEGKCQ